MGLKLRGLIRCGRCGKRYTNPFSHTCVVNNATRRRRTPTKVTNPVTWECRTCHKTRGPIHTCTIKTDFKKRRRKQARAEATAKRRARRRKAAGERKARERARKKTPRSMPGPGRRTGDSHEPGACGDQNCPKYGCRAFFEGFREGHGAGYGTGHADGKQEGHAEGRAEGYTEGRADGEASAEGGD
jgi:hypothetical protein